MSVTDLTAQSPLTAHIERKPLVTLRWITAGRREPPQFEGVVREHMEFYRSKARVAELKRLLQASDTLSQVRLRMLAVCAGAEGGLDTVIEALLGDLADGRDDAMRLIERAGLPVVFGLLALQEIERGGRSGWQRKPRWRLGAGAIDALASD